MLIWGGISFLWAKRDMHLETLTWEMDHAIDPDDKIQLDVSDTEADHKHSSPTSPATGHSEDDRGRDEQPKPDLESKKTEVSPSGEAAAIGTDAGSPTTAETNSDAAVPSAPSTENDETPLRKQETASQGQ